MRTRSLGLLLAALSVAGLPAHAAAPVISALTVSPLKTGSRFAVTWTTNEPTVGVVQYGPVAGQTLFAPPVSVREHADAGTAHLVVIELPPSVSAITPPPSYSVAVIAAGAGGTVTSAPVTFKAANAANAFDAPAYGGHGAYRFNVLVRFDWDLSAGDFSEWGLRVTEFAARVADMTDGWAQVGNVILADAAGKDVNWYQDCSVADCASGADVVVFTGAGESADVSATAGGQTVTTRATVMWQQTERGGIADAGSAIEFPRYACCLGGAPVTVGPVSAGPATIDRQTVPLYEVQKQGWAGQRLAHEFGHYAFWLEDQYSLGSVCENATYEISIMAYDFTYSEIDSNDATCEWQVAVGYNSWDKHLVGNYPKITKRVGAPDVGPRTPLSIFRVITINRGVA